VYKNAVYAEAILLLYTTYRFTVQCRTSERLQTASLGWLKHQYLYCCYKCIGYLYNVETCNFLILRLSKSSCQAKPV